MPRILFHESRPEMPESVTHVWWEVYSDDRVALKASNDSMSKGNRWLLATVSQHGIARAQSVDPGLGFPVDDLGRIKLYEGDD